MFKIQLVKPDGSWSITSDEIDEDLKDSTYDQIGNIMKNQSVCVLIFVDKQPMVIHSDLVKQCFVKLVDVEKE
jgi:hypothetical protein